MDASTKLCIRNCRFTIAGRAPAVSMMVTVFGASRIALFGTWSAAIIYITYYDDAFSGVEHTSK